MDIYSNLKPAYHLDSIADMRAGIQPFPKHIQLILSDLCNQNCHFCSYRMDGGLSTELFRGEAGERNPNRRIPTAKALEILEDARRLGALAVQFTGGGEPTVHPDAWKIIRAAKEMGFEVGLVTNGTKLDPFAAELEWVRISLDAAYPATYKAIRESDRFLGVIAATTNLSNGPRRCVLGVGFVTTPENCDEVAEGCKVARDCGADYIRVSAMFSESGGEIFSEEERAEIDAAIKWAQVHYDSDTFRVINLFGDRLGDLDQASPDYDFCGYQHMTAYIGGDQCVYRCCTTAYSRHGKVGDLSGQSLWEWWESPERVATYGNFRARSCRFCMFNGKNRLINSLVDEPKHVNFV